MDDKLEVVYFNPLTGETFSSKGTGAQAVPDNMPGVVGIFIGGCVSNGVGSQLAKGTKCPIAHAHISSNDPNKGWICFRSPHAYTDPTYAGTLLHEYAHILANNGHTAKWRRIMQELGQPVPAGYLPRRRKTSKR